MQSIETHYLGPTDTKGSRVKARTSSGVSIILGWRDELNTDQNHERAARALAEKLGWKGQWFEAAAPDGRGNVYVCLAEWSKPAFAVE